VADVDAGLRRFQQRHGQIATGRLDDATRAALSVPTEERIRQMELTLDRWRWLPDDLGSRHILVNIPAYELYLLDGERVALQMKVVVGEKDKPTPVFSDEMTHVIFSPTWDVPETIVAEEMLPRIAKDPAYLSDRGIEVTRNGKPVRAEDIDPGDLKDVKFQQQPGPDNALGLVKFVFPNHYAVYLHDTPSVQAFAQNRRALSHGCIRLEKPVEMALAVLDGDKPWTREAIEAAMQAGTEKAVKLKTPLPVHIVYWTSWVDADGTVEFRDDVYGHDAAQSRVLAEIRAATRAAVPVPQS
jgi:murein L,D-transpeptidase YcbB/YkuD